MSHPDAGSTPVATPVGVSARTLPSLVLLVRHGATAWSVDRRHTGRTDVPLTELGLRQAVAIGPLIRSLLAEAGGDPIVFTSPLDRAAHTARLALPDHDAIVLDALMEYDYGRFEGLTGVEIRGLQPDWDLYGQGSEGGEQAHQVTARCDAFIAQLERTAAARPVVAFTHGHLSRFLMTRLLDLPASAGAAFHNDTASIGMLRSDRGRFVLTGWNLRAP